MRKELSWAALWLLMGIGLGLASGRPATGQGVDRPAGARAGSAAVAPAASLRRVPGAGAVALNGAPAQGGAGLPGAGEMGRYAGLWYDIAATPDRFHEGCSRDATTRYTRGPDDALRVENLCRGEGGELRDAEGVLRPARQPGALKLSYAPGWLAWLPLAWSDVQVIDRDAGYRHVVMATPDRRHIWVLARAPAMPDGEYQALLARAQAQGLHTGRLRRIPQEGGDRRDDAEAEP